MELEQDRLKGKKSEVEVNVCAGVFSMFPPSEN